LQTLNGQKENGKFNMENTENIVAILRVVSGSFLVIVFIFIFRKEISDLLRKIFRIKWQGNTVIEFKEKIEQILEEAEPILLNMKMSTSKRF
jgi:hypothetical protein